MRTIWEILGIEPTTDASIIKKAYRRTLPNHHPETDPDGFKALRDAYEAALNYQEIILVPEDEENLEPITEAQTDEQVETPAAITALYDLLNDPKHRFDPAAWQTWINVEINELALDDIEAVQFWVLQTLLNEQNYLSYECARLVIERFHWQEYYEQHHDEHSKRVVLSFIQSCNKENLFNYLLLNDYPLIVQNKIIEFYQTCHEQSRSSTLQHLTYSLYVHFALPIPDDPKLHIQIAHWYMLIDEPNSIALEVLRQCKANVQDEATLKDIDYLINFHRMIENNHYIELLADLNPHFHISIAFQAYLDNTNIFPFIYMAHFFKHHVLANLETHQILSFKPVVPISLPLSVIPASSLRADVLAMIEDYWGNYSFEFMAVGLEEQPKDPIHALLYAVWIIKYGDEWSLESFINAHYEYDDHIANFLLKTMQASAQALLKHFRKSVVLTKIKAALLVYDVNRDNISPDRDDWNQKDRNLVYSWLNRLHPFTSNNHNFLNLQDGEQLNLSPLMREYSTYLFALSESHLDYLIAIPSEIHIWRQRSILMFLFTRTKNLDYLNQHRKLINQLPKTQVKWFDQAFKMLKIITNNKQCHTVDFFWEEIIEDKLKKQPQYANIFYIYHFNWRYIAHQYPKKKIVEYFYIYLMTEISDHPERMMNDANILLAISLLLSSHLSNERKTSLHHYLDRFKAQSPDIQETLKYYEQITTTGMLSKECEEWVPPFTDLLLLHHKIHTQQPFTKYELANLNHIAYDSEHNPSLGMAAVVLYEENPLTLWQKIIYPIKKTRRIIINSPYSSVIIFTIVMAYFSTMAHFSPQKPTVKKNNDPQLTYEQALQSAETSIAKMKAENQNPFISYEDRKHLDIFAQLLNLEIFPALDNQGQQVFLVMPKWLVKDDFSILPTDKIHLIINGNITMTLYKNGVEYKKFPYIHNKKP